MKLLLTCCAVLLFCISATGDDSHIVNQVTDLNALLQTATARYDVARISTLITDDFVLVNGSGQVWDREAFLKDVGDRSAAFIANDPSDVTVRTYNGDCAIVVALLHIKYTQMRKLHDLVARYTDVWVKDGGAWKYATGQATVYKRL